MKGTLSEGVLPGLLRELYVGRKTGLLHFTFGQERRSVKFRHGHIVNAVTNVTQDHLGETLVRHGLLSQADLDRATEVVVAEKKRLGVVLQELGVMDRNQLEEVVTVHVREMLLKMFSWNEGSYEFEEQTSDTPISSEELTLKLSTGEMILEAVRRVHDPDVIRYALGDIDRILGLSSDPLLRFQKITLSPTDGFVVSRVDGTVSAREVTQLIPLAPEDTLKSLFGLLCTGIIEYLPLPPKKAAPRDAPRPAAAPAAAAPSPPPRAATPPPPAPAPRPEPARSAPAPAPPRAEAAAPPAPARPAADAQSNERRQEVLDAYEGLKTRNHFEVLGIPRASNETQVKEAYFRLARRFHPDAHHDATLSDMRDQLEAVFIRLGEAYEVLRNARTRSGYEADLVARMPRVPVGSSPSGPSAAPAAPPPPDPEAEARMADDAIRKAERLFSQDKYWDAIQLLEPAVAVTQATLRPKGQILLARAYTKNPKWVKRGEELLQAVIKADPRNVTAHFVLATIYRDGGLKSRAQAMFRKVLELKPDHEEALAEMAGAATEPPPSGGIIKKLFGKT